MIYTGNNGRIYVARSEASGLQGTFTRNVLANRAVSVNSIYFLRTISGGGRGARVRAGSSVSPTSPNRSVVFTIVRAGSDYEAGDVVRFAYRDSKGNTIDVTGDVTISTTATKGVDSEREILDDKYRIAKIRSWTLNSSSEVVETTALGDTTKSYSPSVTSGDGSATLMFYEDDIANRGVDRQLDTFELIDVLFPRDIPPRMIMNLAVDGSTSGSSGQVGGNALWKTNFLFHAYITSASVGVTYGEVVTIDTSFTVDGPLLDIPSKPGADVL
jgi:hypothetical protein